MQSEEQKKGFETVTFAENEVWGIDILISSGEDGKVRFFHFAYPSDIPEIDDLFACLGTPRGVENDDLPEGGDGHVSAQDEDVACSLL